MKKKRSNRAEMNSESLSEEVSDLREEVRVLRDAIDDFRMELEYLNRNGVRLVSSEAESHATVSQKGIDRQITDSGSSEQVPPAADSGDPTAPSPTSDGKLF